jgi:chaperonin GroES
LSTLNTLPSPLLMASVQHRALFLTAFGSKMKLLVACITVVLAWNGVEAFTGKPAFSRVSTRCDATVEGRTIKGELKPINNFLLVKVADAQEQTEGGILLSGKAKIKKTEGTVISVGPGKTHQESGIVFDMPVAPGEGVVYGKYDGTEVDYNGDRHTLIRDDDILVKFSGDKLTLDNVDVVRDTVLVSVNTKEEETSGGILIAKSSSKDSKPSTGEVVKVGPGRMASDGTLMTMDVSVGDMVKFRDFAGNEVTIEGQDYTVVRMADILAKF